MRTTVAINARVITFENNPERGLTWSPKCFLAISRRLQRSLEKYFRGV